jgi:hypothetical protein
MLQAQPDSAPNAFRASSRIASRTRAREESPEIEVPAKRQAIRPEFRTLLNKMDAQHAALLEKARQEEQQSVDDKDNTEDEEDVGSPTIDVSDMTYIISLVVKYAGSQVFSDSSKYKLGECRFGALNSLAIKKVEKAADKAHQGYEFTSAEVILTAKRITKANQLPFQVDDQESWEKVEEFIQQWMEDGKGDIIARLTILFDKKVEVDKEPATMPTQPKKNERQVYLNSNLCI